MTAKCPMCGKVEQWEGNPFRPFCSKRCQQVDLEGWLSERYRIPDAEEDGLEETVGDQNPPSSELGKT
ncbi:MAG TPA: DNA gyrase inhibitor YacG [Nitrospirales bacterium]|nr:DNA gyrase inhibitor YacG [Nitrospiraceae bacterium]HNP29516.1 DNA gyrase inhibitor YacG [Nitrospirales bacterium]